ncbi:MAG TPA: hypothetical protein VF477_19300 [Mycobacterium sp.]
MRSNAKRETETVTPAVLEAVEETPAQAAPAHEASEGDLMKLRLQNEDAVATLQALIEAHEALTVTDEKGLGDKHLAANVKAIQDCIAKIGTVDKRDGWLQNLVKKAKDKLLATEAKAKRDAEKAAKEAAAAAAKAAAAKAAPKKAAK